MLLYGILIFRVMVACSQNRRLMELWSVAQHLRFMNAINILLDES